MRYEKSVRRILLLFAYFLVAITQSLKPELMMDPDLWWHLQTGQWIIEHGAVPQTDPFSIHGQGKPWVAYGWLFEVLIYGLYRLFGLAGPIIYTVALWLAIAILLLAFLQQHANKFVNAVALAGLGLYAMQMATPRPWLFTILFFIAELAILWDFRQTGNPRRLLYLPLLFVLWANIHIQFVYGLFVIGLAAVEPLFDRLLKRSPTINSQKVKWLCLILGACLLATLLNPYHLKIYWVIYELASQTAPFRYVIELQAPNFRDLESWLLLGVTLGAVFALGWRREFSPFSALLLLAGIFLSFRARRDAWFLGVVAVTIMAAECSASRVERRWTMTRVEGLVVAVAIGMSLLWMSRVKHISANELQQVVAKNFPVAAAGVIEERGYGGPLYNNFDWGGYLIWRLPRLPVAMDGRTNLHGEERLARSAATWLGGPQWSKDPELASANLVIGRLNDPLVSLLRLDQRFEVVYEDKVAAVFIIRPHSLASDH